MWPVPLTQVLYHHVLNWFFLPKPQFWEFIWIFSSRNHQLKIKYLPHSEIQILPNKFHEILLLKIFSRNTKGTFQFVQKNFDYDLFSFHFIFSEEIIQYSRTFALPVQKSWNQAHAPLLIESFPMTPRTRTWSIPIRWTPHNYKTKQTTFLHS